jgi:dCMP deaminase
MGERSRPQDTKHEKQDTPTPKRKVGELPSPLTKSDTLCGMPRVSWDRYFMNLAVQAATRSTCPRKAVGAVIVRDKAVLATGYNGSLRGLPHCTEVGCLMENGHCVRTVHAEANAILQAARNGVRIEDADIYVTASPCWSCFKLIANAGLHRIFFGEFYRDDRIRDFARQAGIELVDLGKEDS